MLDHRAQAPFPRQLAATPRDPVSLPMYRAPLLCEMRKKNNYIISIPLDSKLCIYVFYLNYDESMLTNINILLLHTMFKY